MEGTVYLGVDGAIADNGAQTITPSTSNQAITLGYHNGEGYCAGDSDLISANIKSGTTIFGVDGDGNVADTSSGDAVAGDILSGKIAWVDGSEITGNVSAGDDVNGENGQLVITIPNGLYSNSKTCTASDTDLIAGNIKSGTTIFGVGGDGNVADTSSGDAVAGDILSGKIAWVDGSEITGTAAAGDNVEGANGSLAITIPDGLYSGSKTCTASDTNLLAANIASGTTIFGVAGTMESGRSLLPDTGQTASYTDTYGEDHDYTSANSAVCDRAASGTDASFTDNGDGTIIDNCTNLMWKKCSEGLSGATCGTGSASTMTWENALAQCETVALCNDDTFAVDGDCSENEGVKYNDWRLPNINELLSIVNYSTASPSINTTYFPNTMSGYYYSSTNRFSNSLYAWGFTFSSSYTNYIGKSVSSYVRCVRD